MGRPSIMNEAQYDALREKGYSQEKAARIANSPGAAKRGGEASPYEDWTKADLYDRAKELEIEGRSAMNKGELISALRNS